MSALKEWMEVQRVMHCSHLLFHGNHRLQVALELLPAEQQEIAEAAEEFRLHLDFSKVELLIL